MHTGLIGDYNAHNLLGVAAARAQGHALPSVARALAQVTPVPGRMQRVGHGREMPLVVVDYAHPDALDKALSALQASRRRARRLWCVFGCGGDRDRSKRPLMGRIAAERAAQVLIDGQPTHELPARILADIHAGAPQAQVIEDRATAIRQAVLAALHARPDPDRRQGP